MDVKWSAVIKLPKWKSGDPDFRRLWAYCNDSVDLQRSLQRAYSDCFTKDTTEMVPVPLSVLKLVAIDNAHSDDAQIDSDTLDIFGIGCDIWLTCSPMLGLSNDSLDYLPASALTQPRAFGNIIKINNERFVVTQDETITKDEITVASVEDVNPDA